MATATSNLQTIQQKVRRLTRSLSTAQLSDGDLNQYINTFVLYDFPEHLKLFNLKTIFEFYTDPYVDVYAPSSSTSSPLYDFNNRYTNFIPPVYIAGYNSLWSQSKEAFFNIYPKTNSIDSIGTSGDGVTTSFSGTVGVLQNSGTSSTSVLIRNNVLFSSVDANGNSLAMIDEPVSPTIGNLYVPGSTAPVYGDAQDLTNYINYTTGQFVVTFTAAPASGQAIDYQVIATQTSLPQAILFYDGKFTVRPVPDQAYRIQLEAYAQPTELLTSGQNPKLNEWWQYIAYGSAKKIFEDRMDLESVQMIMPEFKKQEALINRRTIVQQTNQRTQTIYEQATSVSGAYGPGWFSGGGSF